MIEGIGSLFSRARERRDDHGTAELGADARKIESCVLRALAECGQGEVARRAGISDTRLSRWKNGATDGGGLQLHEVAAALDAMGLVVIQAAPGDLVTVPKTYLDALRVLAIEGLS